jgi:hypothetical protein
VRLDEAMAEKMEPQIDVVGIDRCRAERMNVRSNGDDLDIAPLIPAQASGDVAAERRDGILSRQSFGAACPADFLESRLGEP